MSRKFVSPKKSTFLLTKRTTFTLCLLNNNVTKAYEKADKLLEKAINSEAREIAKSYKIHDRAEIMPKSEAFISLKDHKENFHQNYSCRLINPCKSNLGKVTKSILDRINRDLR